jgi:TonB family protein
MKTDWINGQLQLQRLGDDDRDRLYASLVFAGLLHLLVLFGIWILPASSVAYTQTIDISLLSAAVVDEQVDTPLESTQNQLGSGNTEKDLAPQLASGGRANDPFDGLPGNFGKSLNPSVATYLAVASDQGSGATEEERFGAAVPVGQINSDGGEALDSWIKDNVRHLRLGPSAKKGTAVAYRDSWKRWMTISGNAGYPQEAKRLKLRGEVLTKIVIDYSGEVKEVVILESSGITLLDAAVLQTTRGAKWFLPFPPELRAVTDKLEFTYRWRYGV